MDMSLKTIASPVARSGRKFRLVSAPGLDAWARERGFSPRQAVEAALTAGLFPECYERNFQGGG